MARQWNSPCLLLSAQVSKVLGVTRSDPLFSLSCPLVGTASARQAAWHNTSIISLFAESEAVTYKVISFAGPGCKFGPVQICEKIGS